MTRFNDKAKAIELRKNGMSYGQIKEKLGLSKSTLSGWLKNIPLSNEDIKKLKVLDSQRIEKYINTMKLKRESRLNNVFDKVSCDIGKITQRELFMMGFCLYWGEGGKVNKAMLSFTNTDPNMIKYFIKWATECLGVERKKLYAILQLYKDMNIEESVKYWSKELKLPVEQFGKPYIKDSRLSDLTYKSGFGKGTCTVRLNSKEKMDYVLQGLKYLRSVV
ncbi:MAG: helix-turn-helix domain-containing protein [bacterium]